MDGPEVSLNVGHVDSQQDAGDQRACEQAAESGGAEQDADQERYDNGHDAGDDHLVQRGRVEMETQEL